MSNESINCTTVITNKDIEQLSQIADKTSIKQPLVAVYCGSRLGHDAVYAQAATALGQAMAKAGMGLVYGGASIGLMGTVADAVMAANAPVVGVIPEFMLKHEVAHDGLTRLHLTDTMHTRKAIMAEYADAFVTLPGGLGTLEEIMEVATWRQLYQHEKPMLIMNINGYYDHLLTHLQHTAEQGFMSQKDVQRLIVCNTIDSAIDELSQVINIKDDIDTSKI